MNDELAMITVNDTNRAITWLHKNDFTIVDILSTTNLHIITISGSKYSKIRLCKFTWLIKIEKDSKCFTLL